jgi:hypothetical protein
MEMEYGKEDQAILISTKVNMLMTKNVDMVYLLGPVETFIKATISMMWGMAMDKCTGMTKAVIKECGRKESSMVKVKYFNKVG